MGIFSEGNTARVKLQGIRDTTVIECLGAFHFEANRASQMAAAHGAREFSRDDEGRALTMIFDAHRIAEFSEALKASNLLFRRRPHITPLTTAQDTTVTTRELA